MSENPWEPGNSELEAQADNSNRASFITSTVASPLDPLSTPLYPYEPEIVIPRARTLSNSSLKAVSQEPDPWKQMSTGILFEKKRDLSVLPVKSTSSSRIYSPKLSPLIDSPAVPDKYAVTLSSEKSGLIFKHSQYILESQVKVTRRYSDFIWIHQILLKKYHFRTLPVVPPKRLSPDEAFLEARTRSLKRYANFLASHPTLSKDPAVLDFLNNPEDVSVFKKKYYTITDEFDACSVELKDIALLPADFSDKIKGFKRAVKDEYQQFTLFLEAFDKNLVFLREQSKNLLKIGVISKTLSEIDDCPYSEKPDPVLNVYETSSNLFRQTGDAIYEHLISVKSATLERLLFHKELLESILELFSRTDKALLALKIDQLGSKIAATHEKIHVIQSERATDDKELAKLTKIKESDVKELEEQQTRRSFIMNCLFKEIEFYHVARGQAAATMTEWTCLELIHHKRMHSLLS